VSLTEPPPLPQASRLRGIALRRPRIALSFATTPRGSQIRRSPRSLVCAKPVAFDRHCASNGVKRLLGDGDLDHVGDIGLARANRQNSPRAREVSNAGATHFAGQDSKGTPSRHGGPARLIRQQVPCQPSRQVARRGFLFVGPGEGIVMRRLSPWRITATLLPVLGSTI
jgi:hypothetical protein